MPPYIRNCYETQTGFSITTHDLLSAIVKAKEGKKKTDMTKFRREKMK